MATEDQITKVAVALRDEACKFRDPVYCYVEGEAARRYEAALPDGDAYFDKPGTDWDLESWKILARAAIAAMPS